MSADCRTAGRPGSPATTTVSSPCSPRSGATRIIASIYGIRPRRELRTNTGPTTELLHTVRGVLLVLNAQPDEDLVRAAAPWADRIDIVTATSASLAGTHAVLVRPDGHVVWAAPDAASVSLHGALTRWFASPQPVRSRASDVLR
jgi:hypothetical protein